MEQTLERVKTVREIAPTIIAQNSEKVHRQLEQEMSFDAQVEFYTDKIMRNPEWKLAGIFADEGISGTQAAKRPQFMQMIRQC